MGLAESLQLLQITGNAFKTRTARQAEVYQNISLPNLTELVEKMNRINAAHKPFCPDDYLHLWLDFRQNKITEIPPRIRRFLCWSPAIGANLEFLEYLKSLSEPLGANALQGLVYSRHINWNSESVRAKELFLTRSSVNQYSGKNRLIKKWQENIDLILGPQAHSLAASKIFADLQSVSGFCEDWGLNEQTSFLGEVVFGCARLCMRVLNAPQLDIKIADYFINQILGWKNFLLETYKQTVSQTILTPVFARNEQFQEKIVAHIIADGRLGDPRLPVNSQNWIGIEPEARTRLLQILSRADIVFFFDQVMTGYDDRHGRKDFWLKYISSLKQSRPLLNGSDKLRLSSVLRRQGKKMLHFGETRGQQSAFLLDFGAILVVEFNGVGACYIYEEVSRKRIFYDFYSSEPFTDGKLKQPYYAEERIRHAGNWQWKLSRLLSQYGIRPS